MEKRLIGLLCIFIMLGAWAYLSKTSLMNANISKVTMISEDKRVDYSSLIGVEQRNKVNSVLMNNSLQPIYTNFSIFNFLSLHGNVSKIVALKKLSNSCVFFLITNDSILSLNSSNNLEISILLDYNIADWDKDGEEELFILTQDKLYVLNTSFSIEFSLNMSEITADRILVADLDSDLRMEILLWERNSSKFYFIDQGILEYSYENITFYYGQESVSEYKLLNVLPLNGSSVFVMYYIIDGEGSYGIAKLTFRQDTSSLIQEITSQILLSCNLLWDNRESIGIFSSDRFLRIYGISNGVFGKIKVLQITDDALYNLIRNHTYFQVIPDLDNDGASELLILTNNSFGIMYTNSSYPFASQVNDSLKLAVYHEERIIGLATSPINVVKIYNISSHHYIDNISCLEPPVDLAIINDRFIVACKYGLLYIFSRDYVEETIVPNVGLINYEYNPYSLLAYTHHEIVFINESGAFHRIIIRNAIIEEADLSLNTVSVFLSNNTLVIYNHSLRELARFRITGNFSEVTACPAGIYLGFRNGTIIDMTRNNSLQLASEIIELEAIRDVLMIITKRNTTNSLVFSLIIANSSNLQIIDNNTIALSYHKWNIRASFYDIVIISNREKGLDIGLVAWGLFKLPIASITKWNMSVWFFPNISRALKVFSEEYNDEQSFSMHLFSQYPVLIYPPNNSLILIRENGSWEELRLEHAPKAVAPNVILTNETLDFFLDTQNITVSYKGNPVRAISLINKTGAYVFFFDSSSPLKIVCARFLADLYSPGVTVNITKAKYLSSMGLYATNTSSPRIQIELEDDVKLNTCILMIDSDSYIYHFSSGSARIILSELVLDQGNHRIIVFVNDSCGRESSFITDLYVDTTPPVILANIPDNASSSLVFTIELDDDLGIERVNVFLDNDNIYSGSNKSIQIIVSPPDGYHKIRVEAKDLVGNIGYYEKEVLIDSTPPKIEIISPSNHSVINSTSIQLTYRVIEEIGIRAINIFINSSLVFTSNKTQQSIILNVSSEGIYEIKVVAIDLLGNQDEARVIVRVSQPEWQQQQQQPQRQGSSASPVVKDIVLVTSIVAGAMFAILLKRRRR